MHYVYVGYHTGEPNYNEQMASYLHPVAGDFACSRTREHLSSLYRIIIDICRKRPCYQIILVSYIEVD